MATIPDEQPDENSRVKRPAYLEFLAFDDEGFIAEPIREALETLNGTRAPLAIDEIESWAGEIEGRKPAGLPPSVYLTLAALDRIRGIKQPEDPDLRPLSAAYVACVAAAARAEGTSLPRIRHRLFREFGIRVSERTLHRYSAKLRSASAALRNTLK